MSTITGRPPCASCAVGRSKQHYKTMPDIARRFPQNPLLTPASLEPKDPGMQVECLLNPGCFRFQGKIWLLLRVAERAPQRPGTISVPVYSDEFKLQMLDFDLSDPKLNAGDSRVIQYAGQHYLTTISHLRLVSSEDGILFREEPDYPPVIPSNAQEAYGIEDCRVTQIGDEYFLTFTAVSHLGVGIGLRSTKDWKSFEDLGMMLPAHNKDCAIFSEKVAGKYFALHRPSSPEIGGNYIWLAESPDLEHWGHNRCIATTRPGRWDSARIGAGAAPVRTDRGWLEIYHGANKEHRYCLGALLLDLDKPWKILARSEEPIMEPVADYEKTGFFGNVVFTNGQIVDGDEIQLYYGASDTVICGAAFSVSEILATLG